MNADAFGQASAESFRMILLVPEILGMVNIYHPDRSDQTAALPG